METIKIHKYTCVRIYTKHKLIQLENLIARERVALNKKIGKRGGIITLLEQGTSLKDEAEIHQVCVAFLNNDGGQCVRFENKKQWRDFNLKTTKQKKTLING